VCTVLITRDPQDPLFRAGAPDLDPAVTVSPTLTNTHLNNTIMINKTKKNLPELLPASLTPG
jgi:hypothetical protein